MKYCENCGAELEEDAKFCEECGKKVENFGSTESEEEVDEEVKKEKEDKQTTSHLITEEETTEKNEKEKKEKTSLTKKQKIIATSVIAIILFLLIGYQTGSMIYSQERQTENIVEALSSKDPEKLADLTESYDSNLEIDSDTLENFTSYLEENPDYLSDMIKELSNYGNYESFSIEKNGKKFGLYDTYELIMTPVYGTVYIYEDEISVSLGEEELFVSDEDNDSKKVGPFVPGVLNFKAEGEINEFPVTTSEEVTWLDSTSENEAYLELTGDYFSVYSDLEEANVYINDKKIGQLENGAGEFGPIPIEKDMELSVSQKYGDEEISSEKIELNEGDGRYEFYELLLGTEDDATGLLKDAYYTAYQLTMYYEDYIDEYNEYYDPEGPAYKDQRKSFLSFGESSTNDEEIDSVNFDVTINEVKRIAPDKFDIDYEVSYTTNYSYDSDKDSSLRHYSKEATIIFKPTDHPNRDYDSYIHEIRNEELLYEE